MVQRWATGRRKARALLQGAAAPKCGLERAGLRGSGFLVTGVKCALGSVQAEDGGSWFPVDVLRTQLDEGALLVK